MRSLCDRRNAAVRADDADGKADEEDAYVDAGQNHVAAALVVLAPVHVEPEDSRDAKSEPGTEEGTDETEELVEDWNGACDDVGDGPGRDADSDPRTPGLEVALVHDVGTAPHADVNVLDADVGINDTGDDDGRAGDSEGDFLDGSTGAAESGRGDVAAGVVVDDDCDDDVEGDGQSLQHGKRLGKVTRIFQLGNEAEEGDVSGEGDDNVRDGDGGFDEGGQVCWDDGKSLAQARLFDANSDHGDENRSGDGDAREDGDV